MMSHQDNNIVQMQEDIQIFLDSHDPQHNPDIINLADTWNLFDAYAALLPEMPPHLDLQARINAYEVYMMDSLRGMSSEDRLENVLEAICAFEHSKDWDRSQFLAEIIFTTAREIGPQEEKEIATVFCHIAEGIQNDQQRINYAINCMSDAYRYKNRDVANALAAFVGEGVNSLNDIGLSGVFIRPSLGFTGSKPSLEYPSAPAFTCS